MALDDPARLEQALADDRARLRDRLHAAVSRPEIRDALRVASPNIDDSFDLWVREPESERGRGLEPVIVRYFARMTGRPTPFGLFAGHSVGAIGRQTHLMTEERAKYQRHTRLDMDYLFALAHALEREPALKKIFTYRPNSSLYRAAGRVRYVETRLKGQDRSYHLVSVEETDYLAATLARAQDGAQFARLAAALVDDEISVAEAEKYIEELIVNQILVPDLAFSVTGPEPIHPLVDQLREHEETRRLAEQLDQVRTELATIDDEGLGVEPEHYRAIARTLENLPAKVERSRLFQVDMVKPAPRATLGEAVLAEIARGVEYLHRFTARPREDALTKFRKAFTARYESREVPLVEALDEEVGIGFGASRESSPLLQGLVFPSEDEEVTVWGKRQTFLLRKLSEALQRGAQEITLDARDLEIAAQIDGFKDTGEQPPLPQAFAVTATVAAASEAALARGDFRIHLSSASGPSGAFLLGRFCHMDETLRRYVEEHLRAEEALQPDAIFAEIVHLPEGHIGNIVSRPCLRDYEIPYLGRSLAPAERQVPVTDLLVSTSGERLILRSARLGRRVIPRLTNAHNYSLSQLGVYRFLCMVQEQGLAVPGWSWGALWSAPFLPRVRIGRLVLCRAHWRLNKEELQRLGEGRGSALFRAVQAWRAQRRLPRRVSLAEGDSQLPIDLDNVLSIESFVQLIKKRDEAVLVEMFPGPDELCAHGPEGRFVHELIVPFVRKKDSGHQLSTEEKDRFSIHPSALIPHPFHRRFPPGSEWLYVKLYTGTATADHVLRDVVGPAVQELLRSGAAEGWFFIRYGDPDWHLRLRFYGDPEKLRTEAFPALQSAVAPLLNDGRLWRLQLDTYEREVERYGGACGIVLAERLFHADSDAVLEILELLEEGDAGAEERWRLALRGIDALLADFQFDLATKRAMLKHLREAFVKEFRADEKLKAQLSDKFRKERTSLETLLDPARDAESPLAPGFAVLRGRSARLAPIIAELQRCERAGQLSAPLAEIATSYLHMHVNRILRAAHRAQELVLYDFLAHLYESQAARAGR